MKLYYRSRHVVSFFLVWSFLSVCAVCSAQFYVPTSPVTSDDAVRSPGNDISAIGVEFLWLRPTSLKYLYAVLDPYRTGPDHIRGELQGIEHTRDYGFRLTGISAMGRYNAGLEFAYTHFRTNQDIYEERETNDIWGLLLHANSTIDDNDVTHLLASTTFDLNEGVLGSRVSFGFGSGGNLSLSGGLQYTSLRQVLAITYFQQVTQTLDRHVIFSRESTLNGFGPRFTLGTSWNMGGVNLYGQAAAAMLVSTIGGSVYEHDYPVGSTNGTIRVQVDCPYGTRVVPVLSMKLGVAYNHQSDWGSFGMNFGYEVHNYFNAVSTYEFYDDVDSQLGANDQSDVGIDGYFIGIQYGRAFRWF